MLRAEEGGLILRTMSNTSEKCVAELRKLSQEEVGELSAWLTDYRRTLESESIPEDGISKEVQWPDFEVRLRRLFPDGPVQPSFLNTLLEARSSRF